MTSAKKAQTNRQNAKKSTGPKTPVGKEVVRFNALKHGLTADRLLLPGEDPQELEDLRASLWAELQPVGAVEGFLANRVVSAAWRLLRVERVERSLFGWQLFKEVAAQARRDAERSRAVSLADALLLGDRPVVDKERYKAAIERAAVAECAQDSEGSLLGRTFADDGGEGTAFGHLARYEGALDRAFFRALEELRRVQERRVGPTDSRAARETVA